MGHSLATKNRIHKNISRLKFKLKLKIEKLMIKNSHSYPTAIDKSTILRPLPTLIFGKIARDNHKGLMHHTIGSCDPPGDRDE